MFVFFLDLRLQDVLSCFLDFGLEVGAFCFSWFLVRHLGVLKV